MELQASTGDESLPTDPLDENNGPPDKADESAFEIELELLQASTGDESLPTDPLDENNEESDLNLQSNEALCEADVSFAGALSDIGSFPHQSSVLDEKDVTIVKEVSLDKDLPAPGRDSTANQLGGKRCRSDAVDNTDDYSVDGNIAKFAKDFKRHRLSRGLTQTDVVNALGPAFSQSKISRFENLKNVPNFAQMMPILEAWIAKAEER